MRPANLAGRRAVLTELALTCNDGPTVRDLACWTGLSLSTTYYHLLALESDGLIVIERPGPGRGRLRINLAAAAGAGELELGGRVTNDKPGPEGPILCQAIP